MNFYNPYYMPIASSRGLFSNLFKGINFSSILKGTQKTLAFVNQAIPTIKQISPIWKNAKTMFKVVNEFSKPDKEENIHVNVMSTEPKYNDGPTFFK